MDPPSRALAGVTKHSGTERVLMQDPPCHRPGTTAEQPRHAVAPTLHVTAAAGCCATRKELKRRRGLQASTLTDSGDRAASSNLSAQKPKDNRRPLSFPSLTRFWSCQMEDGYLGMSQRSRCETITGRTLFGASSVALPSLGQ